MTGKVLKYKSPQFLFAVKMSESVFEGYTKRLLRNKRVPAQE